MNLNHLNPGHLLHQRYSIQKSLGQGGFGITYLAYDQKLDQEVCIKELFISGNSTRGTNMTVQSQTTGEFSFADFVQRFMQEARQLARFQHNNIVRVVDVFQENNTAYTVMEYVEGETLKQMVQRKGALSEQMAMKLVLQLMDAVEEVHQKGMLHRDIKPDNVLITPQDRVVLIDFGSAREFAEGKTTTQTAMLTPGYAPIEQYSNRAQRGTYTDIYALGATLYYMLTGEKPIGATDRNLEELQPPHLLNNKVSEQISSAVLLAMELKPENRFQSVAEMREALHTLQQRKQKTEKSPAEPKKQKPQEAAKAPEPGKNRTRWYVIVTLVLIIGAFGMYYFTTTINLAKPETEIPEEPIETETEETGPTEAEIEQANRQKELERKRQEDELERQRQVEEQRKIEQQEAERNRLEEDQRLSSLRDIAGHEYKVVKIGNQVWMAENLNVDRFRNGDLIPHIQDREQWLQAGEAGQPAWCYYDNDPSLGRKYGKLYNWYAVNDRRGLAPHGWRVASYNDFISVGNTNKQKLNVKYSGQRRPFTMYIELGSTYREEERDFSEIETEAYWWTPNKLRFVWTSVSYNGFETDRENCEWGYAVRCVADNN